MRFVIDRGPKPLGMVHLDATKLRQAVLNLVSNATKFTHNGEITLRLRREPLPGGDWIEIAVIDTGVGISPDQQKALFSKFTQANARIASKYGGTGLGLSLSRNLCQLMGGDITVESRLGEGSCFTIRLPAIAKPQDTREATNGRCGRTSSSRRRRRNRQRARTGYAGLSADHRGLERRARARSVVDDDRAFLELAERLLLKEGFSAISTNMPRSALQLARTAKPDVILLDILMPDFDGWAVLEALQAGPRHGEHPGRDLEHRRREEAGPRCWRARPSSPSRSTGPSCCGRCQRCLQAARQADEADNAARSCRLGRLSARTWRKEGRQQMPLVLIVEDNPINRDVLGRRLEKRGYSVRFAEDWPDGHRGGGEAEARYHPDGYRLGRADGRLGGDAAHQSQSGNSRHPDHRPHRQRIRIRPAEKPGGRLLRFRHQARRFARLLAKIENSLRTFTLSDCADRTRLPSEHGFARSAGRR